MDLHTRIKRAVTIVSGLVACTALIIGIAEIVDKRNEAATLRAELVSLEAQCNDIRNTNERLFSLAVTLVSDGAMPLKSLKPFLSQSELHRVSQAAAEKRREELPFQLEGKFHPSGWMGDGELGERYVSYQVLPMEVNGRQVAAAELKYHTGPSRWAGIYWQYPANNWGQEPGRNLLGARAISFIAKGNHGGEIVEFKSGGIAGRYGDSYEVSLGKVALEADWREYRIDLSKSDLSNVIGAFAWVVAASDNRRDEVTTYVADLKIE